MSHNELSSSKICAYCGESKPLAEFRRRSGKRSKSGSRRGACKACRAQQRQPGVTPAAAPEPRSAQAGRAAERPAAPALTAPEVRIAASAAAPAAEPDAAPPALSRSARRRRRRKAAALLRAAEAVPQAPVEAPAEGAGLPAKPRRKRRRRRGKAAAPVTAAPGAVPAAEAPGAVARRRDSAGPHAPPVRDAALQPRAGHGAAPQSRLDSPAGSGRKRPAPVPIPERKPGKPHPRDAGALVPSAKGFILMRGFTDKGRRWHQEIDLELAVTLVNERAAIVLNRRTIRRLFSNKEFRRYILERDNYTCYFCGLYGDTIDHLLPRAKGGHTTPDNCVCACNLCNQTKADQYVEDFMRR